MVRISFVFVIVGLVAPSCMAISFDDLLDSYGVLETVAGTGLIREKSVNGWLSEMEGGLATAAELSRPHITMADALGNLYIADKDAHAIRLVTPDGAIHTIAGTNLAGFNGDGLGVDTQLNAPNGLFTFPDGTTYILDVGNSLIRKLGTDGTLTTVFEDPFGIQVGRGLWVSPDESRIFYSSASEVRMWQADEGVSTYADGFVVLGNLAVDPSDEELVVTDRDGHGVYKVYADGSRDLIAGNETTSGGGQGQLATNTGLKEVRGIAFHPEGGYLLATHDAGQIWFVDDDDRIHLLIDGDDDGTHAGDGLSLDTVGRKISEPRAVTLSPTGDLIITEHDAGYIRFVRANRPIGVDGDFNRNGLLDAQDIDLLSVEIRTDRQVSRFDLNSDQLVDDQDRRVWVDDLMHTYFGDSDLDGQFNSRDLVQIFQAGEFEDAIRLNSTWQTGDWNGDGDFTSSDFVIAFQAGGYEKGPRPAPLAVPEPSSLVLLLVGSLGAAFCRGLGDSHLNRNGR
ncbi:MAG: PEP-CTERM sorting domain-containing protein [Planctomycetaceae bacterium]|nr:PEP-CTERM sorting domain-containing protein [Planctomycetaceae bacterium]